MRAITRTRAFAVLFKDLNLWSVSSFFKIKWQWPPEYIKPLSVALKQRQEEVSKERRSLEKIQLVTLHFDGTIEPRNLDGQDEFKGKLYSAYADDVVYSKIDVRNGAIGIVPGNMSHVVVSSEFPVYEVLPDVAMPQYIKLLFKTNYFRQAINSMISGTSGRKRVKPLQILELEVPLPLLDTQHAIVTLWQQVQEEIDRAKASLQKVTDDLNTTLYNLYYANTKEDILHSRSIIVYWKDISAWNVNNARAAAFRMANPSFKPLGEFAEEATELVKPWEELEKEWPVYGVNNKEGVFFNYQQKGKDFNAAYKRIHRDWFFHNPTRSSVGSLGIVPDVPDDALTSPEYQVWRLKNKKGMLPGYVAVLITTPFFIDLIRIHRVGAVKQRLYLENLLQIPIPVLNDDEQKRIVQAREDALKQIAEARLKAIKVEAEVEALILGTIKLENLS